MTDMFRSRVNTDVVPLTRRDPAAARSGLAEGLEAIGRAGVQEAAADRALAAQLEERERARERARRGAQASEALVVAADRIRAWRRENDNKVRLAEYEAKLGEVVDREMSAVRETLGDDPELIDRFAPSLAARSLDAKADAADYVRAQSARLEGQAAGRAMEASKTELLDTPVQGIPQKLALAIVEGAARIDSMDVDPATRSQLREKWKQDVVTIALDSARTQGGFDAAEAWLKSGALDAMLTGEEKNKYLNLLQNDRARAALEAERAQAADARAAQGAAEDEIETIEAIIGEGGLVDANRVRGAIEQGRAAGVDMAKLVKLEGAFASMETNRQFGPAADPSGARTRAAIGQLEAIRRQREFTSEENARYERLTSIQGKRREREASPFKEIAGKDARGDLTALAQIDQAAPAERFALAEAARPGLGYAAKLRPEGRAAALKGHYDLKANPELIKVKGPRGGLADPTPAAFRQHLGMTAGFMDEAEIEGYRGTAAAIYATYLKDQNLSGWQPALFARAANVAAGAWRGSDGKWRGGIGQIGPRHVWLADWATADQTERLMRGADFGNASYGDGSAASKADALANFAPVLEQGGGAGQPAIYVFVNARGRALMDKRNPAQPWRLTLSPPAAR